MHKTLQYVYGQREDDGGVPLCCDGVEGLQVTQLERRGRLGNHQRGLLQSPGGLHLSLGGDHLKHRESHQSFSISCRVHRVENEARCSCHRLNLCSGLAAGLCLCSHRSLHLPGQLHVLDLNPLHLDTPWIGGFIQGFLQGNIQLRYTLSIHIYLSNVNSRFSPHLHAEGYSLSVGQQLRQVFGSKHIPQGGLSQQPRRPVCIVHIGHGRDGALYA